MQCELRCRVSGVRCQVSGDKCYGVTVLRCNVPALTAKHVLSQVYILEYESRRHMEYICTLNTSGM